MKPQKIEFEARLDIYKTELNRIIDSEHARVELAKQIDWGMFAEKFETHFADEGRPAIATRLMVSLHYLKYRHDLSAEETVARWVENPYWQSLSGRQYFADSFPLDPSSLTRWRKRRGVVRAETLLSQTIITAIKQGDLKRSQCQKASVDTTVQTKALRFPTDARLYDRMRERLVKIAEREGLELRPGAERVGKKILRRQQNYAPAKQGRRVRPDS